MNHPFSEKPHYISYSTALPPQAIPTSKKTDKWKRATLDRLEIIGVSQINKNQVFDEYYKMLGGSVSFYDFSDLPPQLRGVRDAREKVNLPTTIKHYDILGLIVNTIVGEYLGIVTKYRIDATDPYTESDYVAEKTRLVHEWSQKRLDANLNLLLLQNGLLPAPQFNSKEEQQQYIAQIEQFKQTNTPRDVQVAMQKNWKVDAVEWAEKKLELDYERFTMKEFDELEATSYMATGRWFREYKVGYDYYKPIHWKARETFFSEEEDIKYPQKGEYVGRVRAMTASQIMNEYGDKLTATQIQKLSGYYDVEIEDTSTISQGRSLEQLAETWFGDTYVVPFKNYHEYQFGVEMEQVSGIPMATRVYKDGREEPSWMPQLMNGMYSNSTIKSGRTDIDARRDVLQVTEGYWRSPERVALLTFLDTDNTIRQEFVTDSLMGEFLTAYEIKKLTTVTLEEALKEPKINTIVYTYAPQVRYGVKINAANSYLEEDIYLGGDILPYQIKGDGGNIYDVQLPVVGVIGNAPIKRAFPYQQDYNFTMNQVHEMMVKEIGLFALLDFNYLPAEFKQLGGSTEELLTSVMSMAKDFGFIPSDFSKQNIQGGSQQNTMVIQDLSLTNQILGKMQLANSLKYLMLEQFGITEQRKGTPQQYATAEGIKVGQEAVFNQTANIFNALEIARNKALDVHLAVAQYSEQNDKEISIFGTQSEGDKAYLKFADPNFHLRELGVHPTSDSQKRKEVESVKQALLQNNTLGGDILGFAEVLTSDTMTGIISSAQRAYNRQQEEIQSKYQHEQELKDKELQSLAEQKQIDREWSEKSRERDRQTDVAVAAIGANAKVADNNANQSAVDAMNQNINNVMKQQQYESDIHIKEQKNEISQQKVDQDYELAVMQEQRKLQELQERRKDRESREQISIRNKN